MVLNQKAPAPIVAEAWSKAEGVGGQADSDYSLYLDLVYADGTPLWGQTREFRTGTHDWQRVEVRIFPAKPVKSVTVNLLLRRHAGKAYFKDAQPRGRAAGREGRALRRPAGALPCPGRICRTPRFVVRDVAADSDFMPMDGGPALGLAFKSEKKTEGGATFITARLEDTTGKDRAVTLAYIIPVEGGGWDWLAGPRARQAVESPRDYQNSARAGNVGSERPVGAVSVCGHRER